MTVHRDVSEDTASMRRARRWLAESREEAARLGQTLPAETVAWFEHLMACRDCTLREDNDPDLCAAADAIADGSDAEEE